MPKYRADPTIVGVFKPLADRKDAAFARVISYWVKSVVMHTVSRRWLLAVIFENHVRSDVNLIWVAFAIKIPVDQITIYSNSSLKRLGA